MRDEIATWGMMDLDALSTTPINHPLLLAYKARMLGGKTQTSHYADWTDFLLKEFGPRKSCYSLGIGMGRVENYLINAAFCRTFNTMELAANAVASAKSRTPELNATTGDLNFLELPKNAYDFILCHGVMHHLINIEHVMDQVNNALTDDGIFLIYEYIGPNRWQFPESTMHFLERNGPDSQLVVPKEWEVGGFESVRSADIAEVFQQTFGSTIVKEVYLGGAYFPFVTCAKAPGEGAMRKIVALDEAVTVGRELPPCYMMAIARKTSGRAPKASPWSDQVVRERLKPAMPLWQDIVRAARRSPAAPLLRKVKKFVDRSLMS